jgi:hypothetical protein
LPEEKGVEIARKLCLALAAVHEQGVLHRDLKPHNVMLDGRGKVRLTDFGLAAAAEDVSGAEVRSGTPAYQAPEQLRGEAVSVQSDLFALGLVLYEVFTGKRAFPAATREELARAYESGSPSKPSSRVAGLSQEVERAVLRCLELEAKGRPRSAYEVLAGLPGGDPLAAALAAGDTPSPQMVADAPVEGRLSLAIGLTGFWLWMGSMVLLGVLGLAGSWLLPAGAQTRWRSLAAYSRIISGQVGLAVGLLLVVGGVVLCVTLDAAVRQQPRPRPLRATWDNMGGFQPYYLARVSGNEPPSASPEEVWRTLLADVVADPGSQALLRRLFHGGDVKLTHAEPTDGLPPAGKPPPLPAADQPTVWLELSRRLLPEPGTDGNTSRLHYVVNRHLLVYLEGHHLYQLEQNGGPPGVRLVLLLVNDHLLRKGRGYQLYRSPYGLDARGPAFPDLVGPAKDLRRQLDDEIAYFARQVQWPRED